MDTAKTLPAYQKLKQEAETVIRTRCEQAKIYIQIGSATCENAAGAVEIANEFQKHIKASGRQDILLRKTGCTGKCSGEPIVTLFIPGQDPVLFEKVDTQLVHQIFTDTIMPVQPLKDWSEKEKENFCLGRDFKKIYGSADFFQQQNRIALRNFGLIDPEDLNEYVHNGGFQALATALTINDPQWIIKQMKESKLRGRGGGGYLTGLKWDSIKSKETTRYIICNADEGDPGAFMDRSMLEGDPYNVIEGMIIGGFAISAGCGFFYIRAEYPMAIQRVQKAILNCRKNGLLGKNILGSGFDFDIDIRLGAGAFVCGEETALIHSIEGQRGQPRVRPPYPTEEGLWGKPTVINNVETFANIPAILLKSPEWFSSIGSSKSGGSKVFALAGKIERTGLVEVPIGTTLRQIIYDIGGGVKNNKKLKAIQTGGPAGGCIPVQFLDTPVDYDTFLKLGSIMGSGGMIVMDEDDCMVDIAKFFLTFSQTESCGKCTPCREGTKRMLEILERITAGKSSMEDLAKLERLAKMIKKASLCGLGRAAPNPVVSTLQYFKDEYITHVRDKHCAAGKCSALIRYEINAEACIGCTLCAKNCPPKCISGELKKPHVIDQNQCIRCGKCFSVCRFRAVVKN